jgi:nicotinate-nucleotide pyrophosphorylase (carboxylating)
MTRLPDIAADAAVRRIVRAAVEEDVGTGDVTSLALVPADSAREASVITRRQCIVAGTTVASAVFAAVDSGLTCVIRKADGGRAEAGETILSVSGPARGILTAERTALNFMQRLCGIATLTGMFVDAVAGLKTIILDTRKTTPCLRILEKYAVLCGGGVNHRSGLYDRVLIKDNHRALWAGADRSLDGAVREARRRYPGLEIEIEVESEAELRSALAGEPDWVLLDNMAPGLMRRCVALCAGRCRTEASGGISLSNIRAVAETGVDAVSLGCLTHSAPAADLTLEVEG